MSRNKVLLARRRRMARRLNLERCRTCGKQWADLTWRRWFRYPPRVVCFDCSYRLAIHRSAKAIADDWDRRALEYIYSTTDGLRMKLPPAFRLPLSIRESGTWEP